MMIPSLFALGMIYYYYNSLPSNFQTILTTSVKTILVCHMIFNISSHISLSSSVIYDIFNNPYNDQNESLGNQTIPNNLLMSENCMWTVPYTVISFQYPAAMMIIAFTEFQIFRAALEFFPHEFLALNQDVLAYPMIFSVPTIACLLLGTSLMTEGTLCYRRIVYLELYYLQIPFDDRFLLAHHDPFDILRVPLLSIELIIQVKRKWKKIKSCKIFARHNNRVQPLPAPSTVPELSENDNQSNTKIKPNFSIVTFLIAISALIVILRYLTEYNSSYFDTVLVDMIRWWMPLQFIISKQEIKDFVYHKFNQFKSNFGYYQ